MFVVVGGQAFQQSVGSLMGLNYVTYHPCFHIHTRRDLFKSLKMRTKITFSGFQFDNWTTFYQFTVINSIDTSHELWIKDITECPTSALYIDSFLKWYAWQTIGTLQRNGRWIFQFAWQTGWFPFLHRQLILPIEQFFILIICILCFLYDTQELVLHTINFNSRHTPDNQVDVIMASTVSFTDTVLYIFWSLCSDLICQCNLHLVLSC
jgi:hypothetical protein